jgi:hypothetical protein
MPIDLTQFGTRDAKIIRENEGKTPYELLELGLSNKAYQRLTGEPMAELKQEQPSEPVATSAFTPEVPVFTPESETGLKPDVVESITRKQPAQPRLGRTGPDLRAAITTPNGQLMVVGPTGIPKLIAEKQARKLVSQNPKSYKII